MLKTLRLSIFTPIAAAAFLTLASLGRIANADPIASPAPSASVSTTTTTAAPSPNARASASLAPRNPESAITPVEKDPKRHRQFLDRIKQGGIDLLFIGDSITDFWNRVGEKSWLDFAPYHPANFGISGDATEHVIWRLTHGELDGIHPKVAVVMIGTNNFGRFRDEQPEWVAAGIKKILDLIHEKIPETKVLLLAIFPREDKPGAQGQQIRENIAKTNQIIAGYADGKRTRFLDIGKVFLDENGKIPSEIMPDKLHPSMFGYDRWYDAMKPTLDEMMK